MRYLFIYSFSLIFFISCRPNGSNQINTSILEPKDNIKPLLDSFVSVHNYDHYVYELYIDKQGPHHYDLLLYAGERSLTVDENVFNHQSALASTMARGKTINIYSGVERFFSSSVPIGTDSANNGYNQIMWAIRDSFNIITSREIHGAYPFIAFPKNNYEDLVPPVIEPEASSQIECL